jgi:deoxyadenosine/deoxycytidine kinase
LIEGVIGAGKTSLATGLAQDLDIRGADGKF